MDQNVSEKPVEKRDLIKMQGRIEAVLEKPSTHKTAAGKLLLEISEMFQNIEKNGITEE